MGKSSNKPRESFFLRIFFFLLALLVFGMTTKATGQRLKEFVSDSAMYSEQLDQFILGKSPTEEEELFLQGYKNLYYSRAMTDTNRQAIIHISNRLLDIKASPAPHFKDYFTIILKLKKDSIKPGSFYNQWQLVFYKLLFQDKTRLGQIRQYLDFTIKLLDNQFLYESYANRWKIEREDYQILYDGEPVLKTGNNTLVCYAKRDSIKLFNTRGKYYPLQGKWRGTGGKVTYERAGYPADSVFIALKTYTIQMKKADYVADSALLTNLYYFNEPLLGRLEDKVTLIKKPSNADYPAFNTYKANFYMKDLYPGIDYDGGFLFQGADIIGTSRDKKKEVNLYFYNQDTLLMSISSKFIVFNPERIFSRETEINIKLGQDSIYHPDLNFTYFTKRKEVSLIRNDNFLSSSKYYNSYHKVFMDFEQLSWIITEPRMLFTMMQSTAIGNASFESFNYYNLYDFNRLQLMDEVHPLTLVKKHARETGKTFDVESYAHYINKPIYQTRHQLMRLTIGGFVFYDPETDQVKVNNKLYTYLQSRYGQRDYDVININSVTQSPLPNAVLNLRDYDMKINGVEEIFLSDSQNVAIYPYGKQITMKKNRDFVFSGVVNAGLFTFFGKKFDFNYDSFKIGLDNIDSLQMRAKTGERDFYNNPVLADVGSNIQDHSGELIIDAPRNKSGMHSLPRYPIFKSLTKSYVYYEKSSIYNDLYKAENFYFEIYPYEIDSLDNFDTKSMKFDGLFVSDNIFPPFEEKIRLMPDYSLGFSTLTGADGMALYKGKGMFYNNIILSNKGLKGNGKMNYLTSSTESPAFDFFPDSAHAQATRFFIEEKKGGIQYPEVHGKNNFVRWLPYEDYLFTKQTKEPFRMIDDRTSLQGELTLKPSGLKGAGRMRVDNATLSSPEIEYSARTFNAGQSDFILREETGDTILFTIFNIDAKVNYDTRKAGFTANEEASKVEFPANQYIGFINKFVWEMDNDLLRMSSEHLVHVYERGEFKTVPIEKKAGHPVGSHFVSVHPLQDSLEFYSRTARYDLRKKELQADQVHHIKVADALVYPKEGQVTVQRDANMVKLEKAEVLANRNSRYYNLKNGSIKVLGKYNYKGSANYKYTDKNGMTYPIHFDKIWVNDTIETMARGNITAPDGFYLSPAFAFQGEVTMNADERNMYFKGGARLEHQCDSTYRWLKFEAKINPRNVIIPVPEKPVDLNNNELFTAPFLAGDSLHVYTTFLGRRIKWNDRAMINAKGALRFDDNSRRYVLSTREKIINPDLPGNLISLQKDFCFYNAEGILEIPVDFWQVKDNYSGSINIDMKNHSARLDLMVGLGFHFHEEALALMAYELDSLPGIKTLNTSRTGFTKKIQEYTGRDTAKVLQNELNMYKKFKKIPDVLNKTMVFYDLNLNWNQATGSFVSLGQIGLGNLGEHQVNRVFDGYFEIIPKRSGDYLHIYLKADDRHWYMFSYFRGVMSVYSSNETFNTLVNEEKGRHRKRKADEKGKPYVYTLATDTKLSKVMQRMTEVRKLYGERIEEEATDTLGVENIQGIDSLKRDSDTLGTALDSLNRATDTLGVPLDSLQMEIPADSTMTDSIP